MAKKWKPSKVSSSKPQETGTFEPSGSGTSFFPFAQYTSIVGVHTTLLAFTALFLPRTTFLLKAMRPSTDEVFVTSRDKPQHPFLEALTLSPTSTLLCICGGVCVLQAWWGGYVRNWAIDYSLVGSDDDKSVLEKQKMVVCTHRSRQQFLFA